MVITRLPKLRCYLYRVGIVVNDALVILLMFLVVEATYVFEKEVTWAVKAIGTIVPYFEKPNSSGV